MPATAEIRPLRNGDVPAAAAVSWEALRSYVPEELRAAAEQEATTARRHARITHCACTDPDGAWVAEDDGVVVGIALAIVREGIWGLSLLAVAPDAQAAGLGKRLLDAALGTADGARGAMILSTTNPRAMRRYARAGFAARPCLDAGGAVNRTRLPAGLRSRPGDLERDNERIDACSRAVRGASHLVDVPAMLAAGGELLVCDDTGFAVHREGSPVVVAARDEAAAADLLWSGFAAAAPGASVHVDFIGAGNDWAIGVVLDAGLTLGLDGPMFVRGRLGPLAPYLPSGAYL